MKSCELEWSAMNGHVLLDAAYLACHNKKLSTANILTEDLKKDFENLTRIYTKNS